MKLKGKTTDFIVVDATYECMKFEKLYEQMCKTCTRAVQCHEECTECDEFTERLESEVEHE